MYTFCLSLYRHTHKHTIRAYTYVHLYVCTKTLYERNSFRWQKWRHRHSGIHVHSGVRGSIRSHRLRAQSYKTPPPCSPPSTHTSDSYGKSRLSSVILTHWLWNRRRGSRAQPSEEWRSHGGYDKTWLEPIRLKMVEDLTSSKPWTSLYAHCNTLAYMLNDTPTSAMTVPRLTIKGQKLGGDPIPGNRHPFPWNSWNNPPTR